MERVTGGLDTRKNALSAHVVILARIANYAISIAALRACLPSLKRRLEYR
jgi:hypothetical protein